MNPSFASRLDAAERLSAALQRVRGRRPIVLAIARGAVGMGAALADALDAELDVLLVRKLRAPFCPPLAVGAIDESGAAYVARHAPGAEADERYLQQEKRFQLATLRDLAHFYRGARPRVDVTRRTVIVVDDGMATGTTMMAALLGVRTRRPAEVICAVSVAPAETLFELAPCADEFVCLEVPGCFEAVSLFYRSFPDVSHEDAAALLAARARTTTV